MTDAPEPAGIPERSTDTTAERPWPVRVLTRKIGDYIANLPPVWVEGQVLNVKAWRHMVFVTLRDTEENMSMGAVLETRQVEALGTDLVDGTSIVIRAKPAWWTKNGNLQLQASEVRTVGVGDLLQRIEQLRQQLAAEGLFDDNRKVSLPRIPRTVGLVCATQGDAEHDVVTNATARWPGVRFEIRRVTVQGPRAVPEVTAAIGELDAMDGIDVIVVARGGGSFEDLLAFSDERLLRAAADCATPLVSAIGHEKDAPLLDLVADLRASTPTDAGKRIVPDAEQERQWLAGARALLSGAVLRRVDREAQTVAALASRPALASPLLAIDARVEALDGLRHRTARAFAARTARIESEVAELTVALGALSPVNTVKRGYAIVRAADGSVVSSASAVAVGDGISIAVADGAIAAEVTGTDS